MIGDRNNVRTLQRLRKTDGAIERRRGDPEFMAELADLLYYQPEQLSEDIQALRDRMDRERE